MLVEMMHGGKQCFKQCSQKVADNVVNNLLIIKHLSLIPNCCAKRLDPFLFCHNIKIFIKIALSMCTVSQKEHAVRWFDSCMCFNSISICSYPCCERQILYWNLCIHTKVLFLLNGVSWCFILAQLSVSNQSELNHDFHVGFIFM